MASDRVVSRYGGRAFFEIHTFEDCVLAVPFFDREHSLLPLLLPRKRRFFHGLLFLKRVVIGE